MSVDGSQEWRAWLNRVFQQLGSFEARLSPTLPRRYQREEDEHREALDRAEQEYAHKHAETRQRYELEMAEAVDEALVQAQLKVAAGGGLGDPHSGQLRTRSRGLRDTSSPAPALTPSVLRSLAFPNPETLQGDPITATQPPD